MLGTELSVDDGEVDWSLPSMSLSYFQEALYKTSIAHNKWRCSKSPVCLSRGDRRESITNETIEYSRDSNDWGTQNWKTVLWYNGPGKACVFNTIQGKEKKKKYRERSKTEGFAVKWRGHQIRVLSKASARQPSPSWAWLWPLGTYKQEPGLEEWWPYHPTRPPPQPSSICFRCFQQVISQRA